MLDGAIETLKASADDEAVHAARKACKYIRAALRLLRDRLGSQVYLRENRRVRDAAGPLTALRDAFVLRRLLRTLPMRSVTLQRGLDGEYRKERYTLERRRARTVLKQLTASRESLIALPAIDSEVASAVAGVKRTYRGGRSAFADAQSGNDQALHEWRKQAKYLLNELEILQKVFNARFKKLSRRESNSLKSLVTTMT